MHYYYYGLVCDPAPSMSLALRRQQHHDKYLTFFHAARNATSLRGTVRQNALPYYTKTNFKGFLESPNSFGKNMPIFSPESGQSQGILEKSRFFESGRPRSQKTGDSRLKIQNPSAFNSLALGRAGLT